MAYYAARPDGLMDVTNDEGMTLPMALGAQQLESMGVMPAPAAPPPLSATPGALASNDAPGIPLPQGWQAPVDPAAAPPSPTGPSVADAPASLRVDSPVPQTLVGATPMSDDEAARRTAAVGPSGLVAMPAAGAPSPDGGGGYSQPYQPPVKQSELAAQQYLQRAMQGHHVGPTPERDLTVGYTVQRQGPTSEAARDNITGALLDREQQFEGRQALAMDQVDVNALERENVAKAEAAELADRAKTEARKAAAVTDLQRRREASRQAVPSEIDPNRWDRAGGLGRILGAISIAVGGYKDGLVGGGNPGMQLIQQAIRDDIDAQKEEIGLAQDKATLAGNDYQRLLDTYGDPLLAEQQMRIEGLDAAKKAAQLRADKAQDEVTKADLLQTVRDLNLETEKAIAEMDGQFGQVVEQHAIQQARAGGYVGKSPLQAAKEAAEYQKAMGTVLGERQGGGEGSEKLYRESQVRLPATMGGGKAWAKDKESATLAQGVIEASRQYDANMDELLQLSRGTAKSLSPEDKAHAEALVQSNTALMKQIEDLGAITSADQELIAPLTGMGVTDFFALDDSKRAAMEVARKHVQSRVHSSLRNLYSDPELNRPIQSGTRETLGARPAFGDR